jgi:hypothetical protein
MLLLSSHLYHCGWSCIPSSRLNERCTLLRYQRKTSSLIHRSISYHWQVWINVFSSGVTSEASGSSLCVSCLSTQKLSEASGWCCYQRHHLIETWFDVQGTSQQGSQPTRLSHAQQDYSVLPDPMEWSLRRWSKVGIWGIPMIQLPEFLPSR